jgi:hypothetical protein
MPTAIIQEPTSIAINAIHQLQACHPPITGLTWQGPMEVRMVIEDLKHLVQGEEADGQ